METHLLSQEKPCANKRVPGLTRDYLLSLRNNFYVNGWIDLNPYMEDSVNGKPFTIYIYNRKNLCKQNSLRSDCPLRLNRDNLFAFIREKIIMITDGSMEIELC